MHHVTWGASALDYQPCRYGQSRLLFRGPKKQFDTNYIAVVGGGRSYGKFVATPFADLLDDALAQRVVNLGCLNAGLDAFVNNESLISICLRADLVVLEVQGITDFSNRFYAVHPRRNDRFVQASVMMERLFPEVDFVEFNFTRHMLTTLQKQWPERVELVLDDLRETWVNRMERLLKLLPNKVVLLWMSDHPPLEPARSYEPTLSMVERVRPHAEDFVEVVFGGDVQELGTEGMHFLPHEGDIAGAYPGPAAHLQVADALAPVLQKHMSRK